MPPLSLVYGLCLMNPQYRSKHETLHNTAKEQIHLSLHWKKRTSIIVWRVNTFKPWKKCEG